MNCFYVMVWTFFVFIGLVQNPLAAQTADDGNTTKLEQRDRLYDQAAESTRNGQLDEAMKLLEQVYALEESHFGVAHENLLKTLDTLAQIAEITQDSQAGIDIHRRAHRITEQLYGETDYRTQDAKRTITDTQQNAARSPEDHARLQQSRKLSQDVLKLYNEGKYSVAISVAKQVAETRKTVLGEQHTEYAKSLNHLGMLYQATGNYPRAEPLYIQAMEIVKTVLGEQHPDYATSLNNLALLYDAIGDYNRAMPLIVQAVDIRKLLLGEQHPSYGSSLASLARIYQAMGDYPRAEPLYLQSLEIAKASHGEQHPDYASSLHNLAELYRLMGDYTRAEPLYAQAAEIIKGLFGEQHPQYAACLFNLGVLYYSMGDYPRAEPLFVQAMEILKVVVGEQHPDYATGLNNLAELYRLMEDYPRAETILVQAIEIYKSVLGEQHPDYAIGLNNLAELYRWMNDYKRAEPLYVQAIKIWKSVLGDQHPSYAQGISNLASLYYSMRQYKEAEPLFVRATEIWKATLGDQHPLYAQSTNNLAVLYARMRDYTRAEPLFVEAIEITRRNLDLTASVQTESQQIAMNHSLRYQLDNAIGCSLEVGSQSPMIIQNVMAWKGSVFVRLRGLRLAAADPLVADSFKALQVKTQRLSALTNSIPEPEKLNTWREQVAELTGEKEKLDTQLMRDSTAFRAAQQKVSLDEVRQAIPKGGTIVNYLEYHETEKRRSLMATVVRRDSEPVMVRLGSAAEATDAIRRWRETLGADDVAREAGLQLRKQLWEPLVPHLGDASLIFISTDGMLGHLPFAALPGKTQKNYLIEDHAIVMLPVPTLLPKFMQRPKSEPGLRMALLMGDVDYDSAAPITPPPGSKTAESLRLASSSLRGVRDNETYNSLPATGAEIDAIAGLFRTSGTAADHEIVQLRGSGATESAFRGLAENTRWMHLASHGFFAAADKKNALITEKKDGSQPALEPAGLASNRLRSVVDFSPGQLSGLVFAGANRRLPPEDVASPIETLDDGIITADEIIYLQLENLELAVLSACETGLGETAGGEGVLGLQRALQIAGARTTVTSLWKVDDAATQALMVEFYRNHFERKLGKLESLRQAQLWLLNNPEVIEGRNLTTRGSVRPINITNETKTAPDKQKCSLPAYWAAFQLSGDPR